MNALPRTYVPFGSLRREIDRLFDEASSENTQTVWAPRLDLSESEDAYLLRLDTPGLKKDAVQIDLEDGTLRISGERTSEHSETDEKVHRAERTYGRFFRSITLPQASDHGNISASMEDGVLTVRVPKREDTKPRRIEIQ